MPDNETSPADSLKWYLKPGFLIAFAIVALLVIGALSGTEQSPDRPASNSNNDLPPEYETFERAVANQSDCDTLAAMGRMQQENGDQVRWAIIAMRVTEVGCDVAADAFDGFYGF